MRLRQLKTATLSMYALFLKIKQHGATAHQLQQMVLKANYNINYHRVARKCLHLLL